MQVIEAKIAGEKPAPAKQAEPTKIGDLMAALEASVAAARETRRGGAKAEKAAKPKPARAKSTAARKRKAAEEEAPAARRRKTA
jgi:DNA end-binding protein Ku